jgi:hypothetical protein
MEVQKERQRRRMLSRFQLLHVARTYVQAFRQRILTNTHRMA